MRVEISLAEDYDENFEHEGYYDSYDDAIEALMILKYGGSEIIDKYLNAILHIK